jgi:hypothetical protein
VGRDSRPAAPPREPVVSMLLEALRMLQGMGMLGPGRGTPLSLHSVARRKEERKAKP